MCPVALTVELADGRSRSAAGPMTTRTSVTLAASRRSSCSAPARVVAARAQVRAWDWTGADADIDAVVAVWSFFGPATDPIIE